MVNVLALSVFFLAIFFFFRSLYDLYRTPLLNKQDKTNLAYLVCMLPVMGSFIFYYFLFRQRRRSGYRSFHS
ncbi:hypothetical protein C7T94_02750 [Pedobacter yulinensis]|uniref:Uncharacterized protein n=1 Tax=Pedobacter yulinensis TaxID=2126353 RepID=A0A2T3HRJ7_9SPHI|nr:hypothetical protein [Pedobacter yulinensis]PST85049.1 hypothetical protein C7T94_02750 [Pedobacter yulinensis]